MIKVIDDKLWRGGEKIGWLDENRIYDHEGRKLGYFEGESIYNVDGHKIGYIEGDEIHSTTDDRVIRLEDNHEHVSGGEISDVARAAIRLLLGD